MSTNTRFTDEFKKQIVALYNNGKSVRNLSKEYGPSTASIYIWINQSKNTGSFRMKDNLTEEEIKFAEQEKTIKRLKMENDILKQAALIMGRKSRS